MTYPTLDFERSLLDNSSAIIGIDEVGRGALAGPVGVGAFLLTPDLLVSQPETVRDSKLIAEAKRREAADEVRAWGSSAIGLSDVSVIEEKGINFALRHAAMEALEKLKFEDAIVLLDGSHNWLGDVGLRVVVKTKADRDCGSVAAASIVAKVERDAIMTELAKDFPEYGWDSNKGYSSPSHIAAIQSLGPSQHHRTSWLEKILSKDLGLF
ncbi:MAG: ribonuclease HII [Aquiluna sp.]